MVKISQKVINKKLLAVFMLITFLFSSLIIRLFYIQIIDASTLVTRAYSQWTRDLAFVANRGNIVDRNGIILASSTTVYTLYSRPNEIKDVDYIVDSIYEIIEMDKTDLKKKLSKKGVSEVTIKKNLSKDQMVKIIGLDITGLYLTADSTRNYPYGKYLTQLMGFVSSDNEGQSGLEMLYNSYLLGVNGGSYTNTDLIGNKLKDSITTYISSNDGFQLQLTIDYYLQSFVEKAVNEAIIQYNAKSCSCVMMNANSGEVLAISSAPTYDLNDIPRNDPELLNSGSKLMVLTDIYEPGSTFKIITSAIGLEENKIKSSYYCPGYSMVDGQRIKCWRSIGHGSQNFGEGICNSCNCVFMDIALSCGTNTMYDYYKKFGLMSTTGIDFPGETSSILIKKDTVKSVDLARMGFGQAIAVTPMQLITAVSSVLNGGNLYKPYVVSNATDLATNTKSYSVYPEITTKTISEQVSNEMKEYLINVVEKGSGKNAKVDGYVVGGKTGTSQKYENGSIASGKYVSSFLGFTEVNGETIVCLFLVDEPQGYAYYGSIVAAPYVGQIFGSMFQYYDIKPSTSQEIEYVIMPDISGLSMAEAIAVLKANNLQYEHTGESGTVIYQNPVSGSKLEKNSVVMFSVE